VLKVIRSSFGGKGQSTTKFPRNSLTLPTFDRSCSHSTSCGGCGVGV
jgi:hypothetical protein